MQIHTVAARTVSREFLRVEAVLRLCRRAEINGEISVITKVGSLSRAGKIVYRGKVKIDLAAQGEGMVVYDDRAVVGLFAADGNRAVFSVGNFNFARSFLRTRNESIGVA